MRFPEVLTRTWWAGALLVAMAAGAPAKARGAQGVHVALLPAQQTVDPGAEFDLSMEVTVSGSAFNGFDAYIGYDPAALTLIPLSPNSLQESSYFASACPNRFHRFGQGTDRDTITDVLLCSGVSLTGPGQIYKLHFRASSTPQVTRVRFLPGLQFYNAGLFVNPDSSKDAYIGIGMQVGVGEPGRPLESSLRATPNPSRASVALSVGASRGGIQRLTIMDLQGRIVRHLQSGLFEAGNRTAFWDCRNDSGTALPAGVYLATLETAGQIIVTRFVVLN